MNAHPELMADATLGPQLTAIYLYMEDLWEHKIAHYMYAFGMCLRFALVLHRELKSETIQVPCGCLGSRSWLSGTK